MKKIVLSIGVISLLAVSSLNAQVDFSNTSVGGDIGTTGIGITGVKKLKGYDDKWGVRVGYHQFSKSFNTTDNEADYDFDLDLQDFQLMADYHPWNTSFKVTFGALYNGTEFDGKITPKGGTTITIGGTPYTTGELGGVKTKVKFDNTIAPYIGIGWDTSFYKPKNSWGFTFNLGVAYTGSAKVSYTADYGSVAKSEIDAKLEIEKASLQDDLDKYKYLPYLSIGFNYKF